MVLPAKYIIPPLLLLLAAAPAPARRHFRPPRGPAPAGPLRPIATRSQAARVCAELCAAGLGGPPCGATCDDLAPAELPMQPSAAAAEGNASTAAAARRGACDVLCANGLGYPLCGCTYQDAATYAADFVEVCSHFCVKQGYQIFGCQECSVYEAATWPDGMRTLSLQSRSSNSKVNWTEWCSQMCSQGDGGAACNCDLLPMSDGGRK